ncbi:MAG: winged helix-turn-helix transcriptional regulator [Candidatus Kapaibacterium sp.]
MKLTKRQKEVLMLIVENPSIDHDTLAISLSINKSAIQKHIKMLKEKGVIERIGGKKLGYWEIIGEAD